MSSPVEQRRIGPFLLKEEIGVGGMGVVYRATYEKDGKDVAVKVLAPDLVADPKVEARFVRETDILKKLRHPNIIRLFGAGSSKTQRFYAMELVEGGSLDTVLKKQKRLPWTQALDYAMQIAQALEHAHNAGIVHRDLKPANLLLTAEGVLKLSDFGIARDTQATALTQAGKTVGTMNYMSPEQITGKYPVTGKTDLYALGCVIFQMLTGQPPFQAENQAELLFKHIDDVPPSVHDLNPDVPIWLGDLINELLAKDPADRPYDALAVQTMLNTIKERVAKQETKGRDSTQAGGLTAVDTATSKKSGKKKKKRDKGDGEIPVPFYERPWFLSTVLVVMLAAIYGFYRYNVSESRLYSRVSKGMTSTEPGDWVGVENDLERLINWYPDGPHVNEAKTWNEQLITYREQQRIDTSVRFGREPKTEAERLFRNAVKYEEFGDRLTALERFEALHALFTPDPTVTYDDQQLANFADARPTALLARQKADKIRKDVGTDTDRVAFVRSQIDAAGLLLEKGSSLEAKNKLDNIITLYSDSPEFDTLVTEARQLRDRKPSE